MPVEYARALLGGALIGAAAILLLVADGRVAGVSGILGGLWDERGRREGWRWAFLAGLAAGGLALRLAGWTVFEAMPGRSTWALAAAGLLVGFGTRLGSGCTSGHGVCGLGRRSPRSLAATLAFIAAGAAVVYVVEHGLRGGA